MYKFNLLLECSHDVEIDIPTSGPYQDMSYFICPECGDERKVADSIPIEYDVISEVVSENAPGQTPCPPSGTAWTAGDRLNVVIRPDGYYYYFSGVGDTGLYYETDDVGPFNTLEEARQYAIAWYQEGQDA
jgi:hypothetical protein